MGSKSRRGGIQYLLTMKPHFILSKQKVQQQYNKVQQHTDSISYSSKTNPLLTPVLEQTTSCFFSIHFLNELKHIKDKSRVIFLAQAWNNEQIEYLLNQRVNHFVIDNESDLTIFLETIKDRKTTLFLRLKLKEYTLRTEKYYVFGMTAEAIRKYILKLKNKKNLTVGIHFHRKTQNIAEWNYQYELENICDDDTFKAITIINIGGGLPVEYANTNDKVIETIFTKIDELRKWLHTKNIQLMLEPGRFISAPAIELNVRIIGIHENTIIVNASVYNTDMDALIVPVKLRIKEEVTKEEGKPFIIKGITPCSLDLFRYRAYLKNPQIGGTLTFLNAGAYNFHTEFCNLDKIETVIE